MTLVAPWVAKGTCAAWSLTLVPRDICLGFTVHPSLRRYRLRCRFGVGNCINVNFIYFDRSFYFQKISCKIGNTEEAEVEEDILSSPPSAEFQITVDNVDQFVADVLKLAQEKHG